MAWCPFATRLPIIRSPGRHLGGPWHLVHHTTQGTSAAAAFAAYRAKRVCPTVTIDETTIYQHFDTMMSASAVMNLAGGVQTNRLSCIQAELVCFAEKRKPEATLRNAARFFRWAEQEHDIPPVWPNGPPRYGTHDPGGHNRSIRNWVSEAGHYGHSQVPENTHWDPGYTPAELAIIMSGTEPENKFKFFIDGLQVTEAAGATLENGITKMECIVKDLCAAMGWPLEYDPELNWTKVTTTSKES